MKPSPEALRPLWDRALEAEIGIGIKTNNAKFLRLELLAARKSYKSHAYDELITFVPEGLDEVFIAHKSVELPDA